VFNIKNTGLFISLLVIYLFQLSYFNKFLPIQEGWFSEYGKQVADGKIPYLEFYSFIQPIYIYINSFIYDSFGPNLINFRVYGLIERGILVTLVYFLFCKITTPYRSIFLTVIATVFYISNTNDVIRGYYQLTLIFCLFSTFLLIRNTSERNTLNVFFAGFFSGLAFMTKQSTGLFVPVAFLLLLITLVSSKNTETFNKKDILLFIVGMFIPIIIILSIIYGEGALEEYYKQVFLSSDSKGSIWGMLFGFWGFLLTSDQLFILIFASLLFYLSSKVIQLFPELDKFDKYFSVRQIFFGKLIGLSFLLGASIQLYLISYFDIQSLSFLPTTLDPVGKNRLILVLVHSSFYINAILVIYFFILSLRKGLNKKEVILAILSVFSFSFMYSHGLSGVIESHASIISIGLLWYLILEQKTIFNNLKNILAFILITALIASAIHVKGERTYTWWGWEENVIEQSTVKSSLPLLKGFELGRKNVEILDGVTTLIAQNSTDKDSIYTFPHIPLFYLLSDRKHDTFTAVHYFDVCNDDCAKRDLQIIKQKPPKLIILMRFPESSIQIHEKIFRENKRSGQRDIIEYIDYLESEGVYTKIKTYTTLYYKYPIEVFLKNKIP